MPTVGLSKIFFRYIQEEESEMEKNKRKKTHSAISDKRRKPASKPRASFTFFLGYREEKANEKLSSAFFFFFFYSLLLLLFFLPCPSHLFSFSVS